MDEKTKTAAQTAPADVGSRVTAWLESDDGKRALDAALGRVREVEERVTVARLVDPALLNRPFTI